MNKEKLSHILWIGGGTDAGKSTTAAEFAKRHSFAIYHYDKTDVSHHEILAANHEPIQKFLQATIDERWIEPTPEEMFDYLFALFPLRFELVLQDLLDLPDDKIIVVEGFGILPELIEPYLSHPNQAVWVVPTQQFKQESMERRGKPSFASKTSNPALAKRNLYERDMLFVDHLHESIDSSKYRLHITDGNLTIDETVNLLEAHFGSYLKLISDFD